MRKVLLVFLLILLLVGCQEKRNSLSSEEFREKAEAAGYYLEDITSQFQIEEESGLSLYLEFSLDTDDGFCLGRFMEYKKKAQAYTFYTQREAWITDNEEEIVPLNAAVGKNYAYNTYSFRGQYQVVSWLENTIIVIAAASERAEELNQFLQHLGYMN